MFGLEKITEGNIIANIKKLNSIILVLFIFISVVS